MTKSTRSRYCTPTTLASILLCATLLAGCSGAGEADADNSDTTAEKANEVPENSDETSQSEDEDSDNKLAVAVLDVDQGDVVGEDTYTLPGTDDEVTVGILPLEVKDDIMILRLIFTPQFASVGADELISVSDMYPDDSFKFLPTLTDFENLKQYEMLSDTGQYWQPSTWALETVNGDPIDWWGVYAAPEDDISTIDVFLRENLPTFEAVPIQ